MRQRWVIALVAVALCGGGALYWATRKVQQDWEPIARQKLIEYLEERFESSVEIGHLDFEHLGGTRVKAIGSDFQLRFHRRTDIPPMLKMKHIEVHADVSTLTLGEQRVDLVKIAGLEIVLPPKGERGSFKPKAGGPPKAWVERIEADGATLVILTSKPGKLPLEFSMSKLRLFGTDHDKPLQYDAIVDIPKPPGTVTAKGTFGPWVSGEPRQTPLSGDYVYEHADLGVFKGIDGTLSSTGKFAGVLENIAAEGICNVPNFSLQLSGNPVPLRVEYKAHVDGADGDTYLDSAKATLGKTKFDVKGSVVGEKGKQGREIRMDVNMPSGNLEDLLRLALKGNSKFLDGTIKLVASFMIPRGDVHVIDKMTMKGKFEVREANFTSDAIQDKIDSLSQRGRGKPKDKTIDNVPATFNGEFQMADAKLGFRPVVFVVPGALVDLKGDYQTNSGELDFHGSLNLDAAMSDTFAGWKRWALKPFNPIFSKHEVGTFLRIQITGSRENPQFGLDKKKDN